MPDDLPLLLLDIDGVLNPFAAAACPPGFREYRFFLGEDPVRLNRAHGPWLAALAGSFELVWATGWEEEANRLVAPVLGLPRLPVITFPPKPFAPSAKVPAVAAHVGDRPAAWIDDALTPQAHTWAAARRADTLLLGADPAVGLTRAMVHRLTAWSEPAGA
ncbi:HAD domain-containing protein [Kitasatospora viridis]|uniref:Secreted protein n=1 Tax=Kitasatospora viridis TaxID=281105 RepID=A0A561SDF0_9ACTN|nr:HAD domain-containing protein [Kitasatospora viridis]TWF72903.1 hypothetical protein FHX73_1654 [Kitasatospora viridis]